MMCRGTEETGLLREQHGPDLLNRLAGLRRALEQISDLRRYRLFFLLRFRDRVLDGFPTGSVGTLHARRVVIIFFDLIPGGESD